MKEVKFTSRITVLCDCTEEFLLHSEEYASRPGWIVTNYSPISAQQKIYELIVSLDGTFNPVVIVLGSSQELMALCVVIANSLAKNPVEGIPILDLKDLKVWEVFDEENILLSKEDGRVEESSYDSAMRPIAADFQRVLASDYEGVEGEVTQFVEVSGSEDQSKSVKEVLSARKESIKKIDEDKGSSSDC